MRMRTCSILLAGLAMAAISPCLVFDESASLQSHINSVMGQYASAFRKKDAAACEKIIRANFATDYKSTDMKGKTIGLDEWITQDKQHMAMTKTVKSIHLSMGDVKVKGNMATGKGTFHLSALVGDEKDPKKTHKLEIQSKWNCTLKKVGKKWWVSEDKATMEKELLDGKPMPGM
jgi:hypothetical protein